MSADYPSNYDEPMKDSQSRSPLVMIGGLLLLIFACVVCGAIIYYFNPFSTQSDTVAEVTETVVAIQGSEPTPTSILDAAFTSDVNEAVPDDNTPTPQTQAETTATPQPSPTAATSGGRTLDLPDAAASDYAAFLLLEGSLFILEQTASQAQSGEIDEAASQNTLVAVRQTLGYVNQAFTQPAPPEAGDRLITARSEASSALAIANNLIDNWQTNEIGPNEAAAALGSVRGLVDQTLTQAEQAFNEQYGLNLQPIRPVHQEEVRTHLLDSFANNQTDSNAAGNLALNTPVQFSETDLPLNQNLSPGLARRYAGRILELIPNFEKALTTLTDLHNSQPKPFINEQRDEKTVLGVATVKASTRIIKNIELPANLAGVRQTLLAALLDCDTAALYLESGLKDNRKDFETGLGFLTSCTQKLVKPTEALQAFAEDSSAPTGDTSGEAVVLGQPEGCPEGCATPQPGCIIKGDIIQGELRVYHLPGGSQFGQTEINPDEGERWFCTLQEARSSGWLPVSSAQGL